MQSFVDVMDPSRIIHLTQDTPKKKDNVVCKVFFAHDGLVYAGKIELPKGLLLVGNESEHQQVARVGFIPESLASRLQPKQVVKRQSRKDKRRQEREEDRRYDEDEE